LRWMIWTSKLPARRVAFNFHLANRNSYCQTCHTMSLLGSWWQKI